MVVGCSPLWWSLLGRRCRRVIRTGADLQTDAKGGVRRHSLGNIPIVTVRINGGAAEFLFDTGAERSI